MARRCAHRVGKRGLASHIERALDFLSYCVGVLA
jgi:hypothetical protein